MRRTKLRKGPRKDIAGPFAMDFIVIVAWMTITKFFWFRSCSTSVVEVTIFIDISYRLRNHIMNKKETILRVTLPVVAIITSVGIGFAGITSAAQTTTTSTSGASTHTRPQGQRPAVMGKVTAISGNTITVEDNKLGSTSATTYTVDASAATVLKGTSATPGTAPTTSSVSAIAVGDMIAVRGTVSGTSVTATEIMDGLGMRGGFGGPGGPGHGGTRGTVTSVSGNTITLTGSDGKSYTIDASTAKVGKMTTITASDVQVGDSLDVMGTVSGTNVTAKNIMDGVPAKVQ